VGVVTESATQRAILIRLGALPHTLCARTAATACYLPNGRLHRPLPPGWPDITLIVRGIAVAVEVKSDIGKLRPSQETMQAAWLAAGGVWITARRVEDVDCVVTAAREGW
jgi:hypothetical protein